MKYTLKQTKGLGQNQITVTIDAGNHKRVLETVALGQDKLSKRQEKELVKRAWNEGVRYFEF